MHEKKKDTLPCWGCGKEFPRHEMKIVVGRAAVCGNCHNNVDALKEASRTAETLDKERGKRLSDMDRDELDLAHECAVFKEVLVKRAEQIALLKELGLLR